jgi:hypothetical protein
MGRIIQAEVEAEELVIMVEAEVEAVPHLCQVIVV